MSHDLCRAGPAALCTALLLRDFTTHLTLLKPHAPSPAQYKELKESRKFIRKFTETSDTEFTCAYSLTTVNCGFRCAEHMNKSSVIRVIHTRNATFLSRSNISLNPIWYFCSSLSQKGHGFGCRSLKQSASCVMKWQRCCCPACCCLLPLPTSRSLGSGAHPRYGSVGPRFQLNGTNQYSHIAKALLATQRGMWPATGYGHRTHSSFACLLNHIFLAQVHQHLLIFPDTITQNPHR